MGGNQIVIGSQALMGAKKEWYKMEKGGCRG